MPYHRARRATAPPRLPGDGHRPGYLVHRTVLSTVLQFEGEREYLLDMEQQLKLILEQQGSANAKSKQEPNVDGVELFEVYERLEEIDSYNFESNAAFILFNLGFSLGDRDAPTRQFSEEWRLRMALAASIIRGGEQSGYPSPPGFGGHVELDPVERLKSKKAYYLSSDISATIYHANDIDGHFDNCNRAPFRQLRDPTEVNDAVADVKPKIAQLEGFATEHGGYFTARKTVALPEISVAGLMGWVGTVYGVPSDLFVGCPNLQKVCEHVAAREDPNLGFF